MQVSELPCLALSTPPTRLNDTNMYTQNHTALHSTKYETVSTWLSDIVSVVRLYDLVYLFLSVGIVDLIQGALARVHFHEVALKLAGRGKPDQTVRADEAFRLVRHLSAHSCSFFVVFLDPRRAE